MHRATVATLWTAKIRLCLVPATTVSTPETYRAASRMDTPRKLTFWPALKRAAGGSGALEHSSGYCLEPFAVLHLQAPQFARCHSEHPPVPRHYDQRHAKDEHAGRG